MRKGKKMVTVLSYVILAAGLLWVSLPFVWMVLTAFKQRKYYRCHQNGSHLSGSGKISRWHCSKYRMPDIFSTVCLQQ